MQFSNKNTTIYVALHLEQYTAQSTRLAVHTYITDAKLYFQIVIMYLYIRYKNCRMTD